MSRDGRYLTDSEVRAMLRRAVADAGGPARFARLHGINTPQYVSGLMSAAKLNSAGVPAPVGGRVLAALGLRRVVRYVRGAADG